MIFILRRFIRFRNSIQSMCVKNESDFDNIENVTRVTFFRGDLKIKSKKNISRIFNQKYFCFKPAFGSPGRLLTGHPRRQNQ